MKQSYKTKAILIGLAAVPLSLSAKVTMTVSGESPDPKEYTLTDNTVLVFADGTLDVKEGGSSVGKFTLADGDMLLFKSDGAGVGQIADDDINIRLLRNPVKDRLEFAGAPEAPADMAIHSLDGTTVIRAKGWNGEAVDVSALTPGTYLFTIEGKTIKFIKS